MWMVYKRQADITTQPGEGPVEQLRQDEKGPIEEI
jgi:hypothetical protein